MNQLSDLTALPEKKIWAWKFLFQRCIYFEAVINQPGYHAQPLRRLFPLKLDFTSADELTKTFAIFHFPRFFLERMSKFWK